MPDHLTPFGIWLWNIIPRYKHYLLFSGEKIRGIVNKNDFKYLVIIVDWYDSIRDFREINISYLRKSLYVFGYRICTWRTYTK